MARLSRKAFLERSALAALGTTGLYGALEQATPARAAIAASPLPPEQHLMQGGRAITDEGVRVNVPPLHLNAAAAQVWGVVILRYMLKIEPIASASQEELVALLSPRIQGYLGAELNLPDGAKSD